MKHLLRTCIILVYALCATVHAGEVVLRNGNSLDYGPTWEKDDMVYFYFHDYGVAGISKSAVVGKTGLLGELKGDYFISDEYDCKIAVPRGWHAANAVEAVDLMPLDTRRKENLQKLDPETVMKKMGFLVILYENRPWETSSYNPRIMVKVHDLYTFPGVRNPLDYIFKSREKLQSTYAGFEQLKRPTEITVADVTAARHKASYDVVIDAGRLNITLWEYAFILGERIYSVTAMDKTTDFQNMEKRFVKVIESFRLEN